ncbi:MAG TPA: hypothetical protein VE028_03955 [Nitratidesulfovibrio sp.]|nr:hypothetical protein [Nitratidesulfovibrio sp.]
MIVTITRNTVAARTPVFVGDVLELDDAEARMLIRMGKAVEAVDDAPKEAAPAEVKQAPADATAHVSAPQRAPNKRRKGK